jgi:hypothetical protein
VIRDVSARHGAPDDAAMVPELHIHKVQRGMYEAHVKGAGVDITVPTLHESIAQAIKDAGESFPPELCEFLEIRYVDISIGVHSLARMRAEAAGLGVTASFAQIDTVAEDFRCEFNKLRGAPVDVGTWSASTCRA